MKIPNSVTVFNIPIEVKAMPGPFEVKALSGRTVFASGHYTTWDSTIKYAHNENNTAQAATYFLHEVIEAINHNGDLGMNHTQITSLASALRPVVEQIVEYSQAA